MSSQLVVDAFVRSLAKQIEIEVRDLVLGQLMRRLESTRGELQSIIGVDRTRA